MTKYSSEALLTSRIEKQFQLKFLPCSINGTDEQGHLPSCQFPYVNGKVEQSTYLRVNGLLGNFVDLFTYKHNNLIIQILKNNELISLTSKIDNIQELIFVDFVKYTVLCTISFTIVLLIHLCYPIYRNGYMYLLIHVLIDSMKKSLPPPKKKWCLYLCIYAAEMYHSHKM